MKGPPANAGPQAPYNRSYFKNAKWLRTYNREGLKYTDSAPVTVEHGRREQRTSGGRQFSLRHLHEIAVSKPGLLFDRFFRHVFANPLKGVMQNRKI